MTLPDHKQGVTESYGLGLRRSVPGGGGARDSSSFSRAPQDQDLLLLLSDDLLGQPPELVVMTVFKFSLCHVDRGLVVRDHDGREVAIIDRRRSVACQAVAREARGGRRAIILLTYNRFRDYSESGPQIKISV
jgi:hypothetical protein